MSGHVWYYLDTVGPTSGKWCVPEHQRKWLEKALALFVWTPLGSTTFQDSKPPIYYLCNLPNFQQATLGPWARRCHFPLGAGHSKTIFLLSLPCPCKRNVPSTIHFWSHDLRSPKKVQSRESQNLIGTPSRIDPKVHSSKTTKIELSRQKIGSSSPILLGFPAKSNAAATKWHSSKAAKRSMASRTGQVICVTSCWL